MIRVNQPPTQYPLRFASCPIGDMQQVISDVAVVAYDGALNAASSCTDTDVSIYDDSPSVYVRAAKSPAGMLDAQSLAPFEQNPPPNAPATATKNFNISQTDIVVWVVNGYPYSEAKMPIVYGNNSDGWNANTTLHMPYQSTVDIVMRIASDSMDTVSLGPVIFALKSWLIIDRSDGPPNASPRPQVLDPRHRRRRLPVRFRPGRPIFLYQPRQSTVQRYPRACCVWLGGDSVRHMLAAPVAIRMATLTQTQICDRQPRRLALPLPPAMASRGESEQNWRWKIQLLTASAEWHGGRPRRGGGSARRVARGGQHNGGRRAQGHQARGIGLPHGLRVKLDAESCADAACRCIRSGGIVSPDLNGSRARDHVPWDIQRVVAPSY